MTTDEKYSVILQELGEILRMKNIYLSTRDFTIERLEKQLEAAEKKIAELTEAQEEIQPLESKITILSEISKKHGKET